MHIYCAPAVLYMLRVCTIYLEAYIFWVVDNEAGVNSHFTWTITEALFSSKRERTCFLTHCSSRYSQNPFYRHHWLYNLCMHQEWCDYIMVYVCSFISSIYAFYNHPIADRLAFINSFIEFLTFSKNGNRISLQFMLACRCLILPLVLWHWRRTTTSMIGFTTKFEFNGNSDDIVVTAVTATCSSSIRKFIANISKQKKYRWWWYSIC